MTAREYVEKVIAQGLYDPVLTTQLANGFVLKRLIPDYFPGDNESRGYATFLRVDEPRLMLRRPGASPCARRAGAHLRGAVPDAARSGSFEEFGRQCEYFIDIASD